MYVNGRLMGRDLRAANGPADLRINPESRKDPALLEWVYGNVFQISIFQIAPRSEASVRVIYAHAAAAVRRLPASV
jgi:hypothetical protein